MWQVEHIPLIDYIKLQDPILHLTPELTDRINHLSEAVDKVNNVYPFDISESIRDVLFYDHIYDGCQYGKFIERISFMSDIVDGLIRIIINNNPRFEKKVVDNKYSMHSKDTLTGICYCSGYITSSLKFITLHIYHDHLIGSARLTMYFNHSRYYKYISSQSNTYFAKLSTDVKRIIDQYIE